jgi:hypothetical protein
MDVPERPGTQTPKREDLLGNPSLDRGQGVERNPVLFEHQDQGQFRIALSPDGALL